MRPSDTVPHPSKKVRRSGGKASTKRGGTHAQEKRQAPRVATVGPAKKRKHGRKSFFPIFRQQ